MEQQRKTRPAHLRRRWWWTNADRVRHRRHGPGAGALAWLAGDFTGSGKTQIAQPWNNNSRLGLLIYGADGSGQMQTVFGTTDMGQGAGALAWLAGDFTGSGKTQIAQPWDNNSRLGLLVYGADGGGQMRTVFGTGDMGQGAGALAWLAGDFTGSGKTQIAQPWDNNSRLGLLVYGADGGGQMRTVFGTGDMGQGRARWRGWPGISPARVRPRSPSRGTTTEDSACSSTAPMVVDKCGPCSAPATWARGGRAGLADRGLHRIRQDPDRPAVEQPMTPGTGLSIDLATARNTWCRVSGAYATGPRLTFGNA